MFLVIFVGVTTAEHHLLSECVTDREPSVCHSVGTATVHIKIKLSSWPEAFEKQAQQSLIIHLCLLSYHLTCTHKSPQGPAYCHISNSDNYRKWISNRDFKSVCNKWNDMHLCTLYLLSEAFSPPEISSRSHSFWNMSMFWLFSMCNDYEIEGTHKNYYCHPWSRQEIHLGSSASSIPACNITWSLYPWAGDLWRKTENNSSWTI